MSSRTIDTTHPMAQDLVLYYQYDEGQGSVVEDISGSPAAHDKALTGGAWATNNAESVWRKPLDVEGYGTVPAHSEINMGGDTNFSIGAFFAYEENWNDWVYFVDKLSGGGFSIRQTSWTSHWYFYTGASSASVQIPELIGAGIVQLVAVFDAAAGTIDVYVNGALKTQLTFDPAEDLSSTVDMMLGQTGANPYRIDWNRFGVWRRKLSATEVSDWHNDKDLMLAPEDSQFPDAPTLSPDRTLSPRERRTLAIDADDRALNVPPETRTVKFEKR